MSTKNIEPVFEADDTVENADWIKSGSWDLPPYGSEKFFQVMPIEQLDWFRTTVTYKSAVEKGLIHDDEWMGDYVVDPKDEFVDELMSLLATNVKKRDTTFDGILDEEYAEAELPEAEMEFNSNILALAQKALKMPDQDDKPGLRISGRASAATLQAVTNYDTDLGSRAADHRRARDTHMQANNYFLNSDKKLADIHESIASLHFQMAEQLTDDNEVEKMAIDNDAHEAATSPKNDLDEPSDAQKEAGNYAKGHITISGIDIAIENPAGSKRKSQWPVLQSHYGYIKRTTGADGDHTDCFVRVNTDDEYLGSVYVIDQVNPDGAFDEHKVMIGWTSKQAAVKAYLANYKPGWRVGNVTRFSWEKFREWVTTGDHSGPVSSKKS